MSTTTIDLLIGLLLVGLAIAAVLWAGEQRPAPTFADDIDQAMDVEPDPEPAAEVWAVGRLQIAASHRLVHHRPTTRQQLLPILLALGKGRRVADNDPVVLDAEWALIPQTPTDIEHAGLSPAKAALVRMLKPGQDWPEPVLLLAPQVPPQEAVLARYLELDLKPRDQPDWVGFDSGPWKVLNRDGRPS